VYEAGAALPGQRELSAAYGVTLMTLRAALRELSDEGLIEQRPGRGTYVAPPRLAYRLGSLRSFADDLRDQGHAVRTHLVSRAVRRLPAGVAERLRARAGDSGLRLERVREFAGRRAIHQVSWVRQPQADALREVNLAEVSLYAALAAAGVPVARADETIRADQLDAAGARRLDEPAGSPVFVSDRLTSTADGTAVLADRAVILGSVMRIHTERATNGLTLRWGTP
jgi:GntR family transcriptional regulator